jgi:ABC-type glycerol-3-phosphate transport system permease component
MSAQILIPIAVTVLCYVLLFTVQFLYREMTYPLRHLSGPHNPSFLFGNFRKLAVSFGTYKLQCTRDE